MAKHLLVKFWHRVSEAGKLSPLQPTWVDKLNSPGNMDFSPLYRLFSIATENLAPSQFNPLGYNPLEKILDDLIDFEELKRLNPPKLFVCATNVRTCEAKIFGPSEITSRAVLASACLPYLFGAVEIDGEHYWDGGYMGNPPLHPLIRNTEGTDDILLVKVNPFRIQKTPDSIEEIKDRVNEISFNSSLALEMKQVEFINMLVDRGIDLDGKLRRIYLHSLSADKNLSDFNLSSKLNTTWDFLMHLKNMGYQACEGWIKTNYRHLGKQSTYHI